jgi:phenylalanyl-tRNA synthetase beta chain
VRFSLDWLSDFADFSAAGGIEKLASTANEIGLEIGQIEMIDNDTIFDADVTPNRPDAMNHRGFARDLAAALDLSFNNERLLPTLEEGSTRVERLAKVTIQVPERCHRFAARVIRGVSPRHSSERWTRRMSALDLKPIDAIVDSTNLSVWGIGQPLHAFDADKVEGSHLFIRLAKKGEKLLCLDGVERELHPEDVVVADERRALSLAGVIGGVESAITPGATRNVLLEGAWWDPVSIRRTARRHGLHTDASHRYERGADIEAIPEGLALAVSLILDSAGGDLAAGMIDEYPQPFVSRRVRLRGSRLLALSGLPELPLERAAGILQRLGFALDLGRDEIEAQVPSWRPDVSIEEDLVEEVLRIHGYSKIPSELPPAERLQPLYLSEKAAAEGPATERALLEVEDLFADQAREAGLFEAMSFPFVAPPAEAPLDGNLLDKTRFRKEPLLVANPLDSTRQALRRLILPGLLEAASLNHRSGRRSIALFELGRVWDREAPAGADPAETESRHFAAVLAGAIPDEFPIREAGILDAKGVLGRMVEAIAGEPVEFVPAARSALARDSGLEIVLREQRIGVVGRLAESLRESVPLPANVLVAELDLGQLARRRQDLAFHEYSRFPAADVDVTIACRPGVAWGEIVQAVREARLANCEETILLKLFEDPNRPGTRNVTLRLGFRAQARTLSQEEVNRERDKLLGILNEKFGVTS